MMKNLFFKKISENQFEMKIDEKIFILNNYSDYRINNSDKRREDNDFFSIKNKEILSLLEKNSFSFKYSLIRDLKENEIKEISSFRNERNSQKSEKIEKISSEKIYQIENFNLDNYSDEEIKILSNLLDKSKKSDIEKKEKENSIKSINNEIDKIKNLLKNLKDISENSYEEMKEKIKNEIL